MSLNDTILDSVYEIEIFHTVCQIPNKIKVDNGFLMLIRDCSICSTYAIYVFYLCLVTESGKDHNCRRRRFTQTRLLSLQSAVCSRLKK